MLFCTTGKAQGYHVDDGPRLILVFVFASFLSSRCSVSWHADSCLEHYSTIAVYHLTAPETDPADWRIALRVEHDAEGPSAGKLKHAGSKVGCELELLSHGRSFHAR